MSTPRDLFPHLYPNHKQQQPPKPVTGSGPESTVGDPEKKPSPMKQLWCVTQWSNLSLQAKNLGLPIEPYFDPETLLLSTEVNAKMWRQLVKSPGQPIPGVFSTVHPTQSWSSEV